MDRYSQTTSPNQAVSHPVMKATAVATAGGSLLLLSAIVLAGTVIALTVVTPLFVIFSPVLVPAGIVMFMVSAGFATSGGLGVTALSLLTWMYRYLTGKHPPGSDQVDEVRRRFAERSRQAKDTVQRGAEHVRDAAQRGTEQVIG